MRIILDKATAVCAIALVSIKGAIAQPAWPDRAIKVMTETKWTLIIDNKPVGENAQKAADSLHAEQAEWSALIRTANIKLN